MLSHQVLLTTATTIMALEYDGGVVIGADSRTSAAGFVVNRVADKLTPLTDKIYCCRSGSAADTQAIADIVTANLKYYGASGTSQTVEVFKAACELQACCYNNRMSVLAGILVAGWDEMRGGQVYNISLGGMMTRTPFTIAGSGAPYLKGFVWNHYKPGMSEERCIELVKRSIRTGIRCDISSGGVVRIGVIDKDGMKRHVFNNTDCGEPKATSPKDQSLSSLILSEFSSRETSNSSLI